MASVLTKLTWRFDAAGGAPPGDFASSPVDRGARSRAPVRLSRRVRRGGWHAGEPRSTGGCGAADPARAARPGRPAPPEHRLRADGRSLDEPAAVHAARPSDAGA